ncbi:MAG: hypothetical protein U0R64_05890 [Candidatus Nanopelagicales bacterium]
MTRIGLAATLGVLTFVTGVLVMLSGSDLPPPPGFLWILPIAGVAAILVGLLIPVALRLGDRAGPARAVLAAVGVGVAFGVVVAGLLVIRGSGEPSIPPPGPVGATILVIVTTAVGAIAATVVVGWSIVADQAKSRSHAVLVIALPAALVLLPIGVVILLRLAA